MNNWLCSFICIRNLQGTAVCHVPSSYAGKFRAVRIVGLVDNTDASHLKIQYIIKLAPVAMPDIPLYCRSSFFLSTFPKKHMKDYL